MSRQANLSRLINMFGKEDIMSILSDAIKITRKLGNTSTKIR